MNFVSFGVLGVLSIYTQDMRESTRFEGDYILGVEVLLNLAR